ncbi:MAG: CHASE3 domain-containing protein, partial [Sneathiella sp.]
MGIDKKVKKPDSKSALSTLTSKFSNLKTKNKILIGICSPLALLVVLGAVAIININSMVSTNTKLGESRAMMTKAAAIVSSAVNMETGMRGYLLAGDKEFLKPYQKGETETYNLIAELKESESGNPDQITRLEKA